MPKPPLKGATGTPPQPRPASRAHLSRRTTATTQANKQTELNSAPKAAADKGSQSLSGDDDEAVGSPLSKIANILVGIIQNHELADTVRQEITEVIGYARTEGEAEEKWTAEPKVQAKVSAIRDVIRQGIETACATLREQIRGVQNTANEALLSTSKVLKEVEEAKTEARDIARKVSKVTEATDKIASEAETYRDALLARPKQTSRNSVDPKVLTDMDRKEKQILVEIFDVEGKDTLAQSLTELVSKANGAITSMEDTGKPKDIKVLTAHKTRREAVILTLSSKEAADWLREPQNEVAFTKAFSEGSHIRDRTYSLVVPRVPITFEPKEDKHLREIEEVNGLTPSELRSVKWIKPIGRRRPDQTHAYAIFSFATAIAANTIIRDGLNICGTKVRPKKQTKEPIQCMKCRQWGHFVSECQSAVDACGACGEAHRTDKCSNRGKKHCVSCNDNTHTSWDRNCPEFIRRCAITNERNPENGMPYFPTAHDWTLTTRPERIPLDERFPKKYAVNSLPFAANKHPGLAPRNTSKRRGKNATKGTQDRGDADTNKQTNPNLIPLNRRREEGELPTDNETGRADPEGEGTEGENTDEPHPPSPLV
jgi:hypothetical protein